MERLIVIENGEELVFNMESRVVTIGRSSKNDISIKDRNASRRHCNIIKVGDSWFVVDCDSQNGTCVNQQTIKKHELEEGDKITVGAAEIIFMVAQDSPYRTENSVQVKSPVEKNIVPENKESSLPSEPPKVIASNETPDRVTPREIPIVLEEALEIASEELATKPIVPQEKPTTPVAAEEKPATKAAAIDIPNKPIVSNEIPVGENVVGKNENRRQPGNQAAKHAQDFHKAFCEEFSKEIIGYEYVAKLLFISLITSEHCLVSGSPGIGKLSIARTISQLLGLSFQRVSNLSIQNYIEKSEKYNLESFFANHINFIDHNHNISNNVQNLVFDFLENQKIPGERKTTSFQQVNMLIGSDLPISSDVSLEKYKDSFLFEIPLTPLSIEEEKSILERQLQTLNKARKSTSFTRYFSYFQMLLSNVKVEAEVLSMIINIIQESNPAQSKSAKIKKYVSSGPGRRGGYSLMRAAQANAVLNAKEEVGIDDVKEIAYYTLTHRLNLSPEAANDNITKKDIIQLLLGE